MRVKVSITISPAMPDHRMVEAQSTLEAVRAVLNSDDTAEWFERMAKKGGGSIIISSFTPNRKAESPSHNGGPLFR